MSYFVRGGRASRASAHDSAAPRSRDTRRPADGDSGLRYLFFLDAKAESAERRAALRAPAPLLESADHVLAIQCRKGNHFMKTKTKIKAGIVQKPRVGNDDTSIVHKPGTTY